MPKPTVEYLHEAFRYEDGRLYWKHRPREHFSSEPHWKRWNTRYAGSEAGGLHLFKSGIRCYVGVDGRRFYRYQIVFAMHHGFWADVVDHENQDPSDDRIENLRPANQSQNGGNAKISRSNTSGLKGVCWDKQKCKWKSQIRVNYKRLNIGLFDSPAEAHAAYLEAAKKYFGDFHSAG